MHKNPYQRQPDTSFWSTGVAAPVNAGAALAIAPLPASLSKQDTIVSAGSCFGQYIGQELIARGQRYLTTRLARGRTESFGIGNLYSVAQFRQWLEFALQRRGWSEDTVIEQHGSYFDGLLPHREGCASPDEALSHRLRVAEELVTHLRKADVLIFTVGMTETWRNLQHDVLPACPGTRFGTFDASLHRFENAGFEQVVRDLEAVDRLLADINPGLRTVFTVSPVPLTATATEQHVLLASSQAKATLRAAVGQFCQACDRASYFPSYELITHQAASEPRFERNLRTVSRSGVDYVMRHAFGEHTDQGIAALTPADVPGEAVCEESLLDAYARRQPDQPAAPDAHSPIFLIGDSHLQALAHAFERIGVQNVGGQIMNGSGFSENRFELSDEFVFIPTESVESRQIWAQILARLQAAPGPCRIITNIGQQTHRTINDISNRRQSPITSAADIADHFLSRWSGHVSLLRELTRLGDVWMLEDPGFHAFQNERSLAMMIRGKNFQLYCAHVRTLCTELRIGYLDPCDGVIARCFSDTRDIFNLIAADGFHGTPLYYDYCAATIARLIGADDEGADDDGTDNGVELRSRLAA